MVRVLFIHPDLGIGGAERLVVDAAVALRERGHEVSFLTNHHDTTHCFQETRGGNFQVTVVGDWLPRQIFGRFYAFCAYFRMLYAAFYASFGLLRRSPVDVVFCDQISIGIPVLRLARPRPKVLFYCHFPDQLLSKHEGCLKRLYRTPIDYLEESTVGMADKILVNSKFTLRVFRETFRRLDVVPDVLYPSLNTKYFDEMQTKLLQGQIEETILPKLVPRNAFIFLDINRFERKKNHALALQAFRHFLNRLTNNAEEKQEKRPCLVIAGGYDKRVPENVQHFEELQSLMQQLKLEQHVVLLRSPSDDEKFALLNAAHCLLYTPENEHFGIVPLESMYMSRPVIALNSGGPTETIVHNDTGLLCEQQIDEFAGCMLQLYQNESKRKTMGAKGRKRVQQQFSFEAFTSRLDNIVVNLCRTSDGLTKKDN